LTVLSLPQESSFWSVVQQMPLTRFSCEAVERFGVFGEGVDAVDVAFS